MTRQVHPLAIGWRYRSVSGVYVLAERKFPGEAAARAYFDDSRTNAKKHGGAGRLIHDGAIVATFSHSAENE